MFQRLGLETFQDLERDFAEQSDSIRIDHVPSNVECFRAYVDVDRDFILVNRGCVWV